MGKYTLKFANPLGKFDETYGQKYWGEAHDVDMDISFNLMNPVNFEDGDEIEFDTREIKEKGPNSKNPGEEYLFLKKVRKLNGSGEAPGSSSTPSTQARAEKPLAVVQDKYLKDIPDYPMRVYTAGLPYIDFQYMLKTPAYLESYMNYVERASAALLGMSAKIRAGELKPSEEPVQPLSGRERARETAEAIRGKMSPEEAGSFLEEMDEE